MVYAKIGGQTECIMGNSKIENCGVDNFSRGLFCGILSYCGIRLNMLDAVFLIFGSIFDLV